MVQIRHDKLENLVEKHYDNLKSKIKKFPDCDYTIKEVITSKPQKLHEIALAYRDNEDFDFMKVLYKNFTTKKNEYSAYDLAKSLNIKSCPYCNRNYTFVATKSKKKILRPDIDHFYDKDTYPILALSFYNLIPSCSECNRTIKRVKQFSIMEHIHPYMDSVNKYAKFKLRVEKSNFYHDESGFKIEFKSENTKAQKNIDDLKLQDIYNEGYKDTVLELIQKSQIYNESYVDELYQNYEGTLFKNREDLLRLVTCGYVSDDDLHKRPLSKLIKDISEELDLL